VEPDSNGGLWITLPSGRRYHRPAEPVLETFDADTPDRDTPDGDTPTADQTAPAGDPDKDPAHSTPATGEDESRSAEPTLDSDADKAGANDAGPSDPDDDIPPF
jgi:hypothetical protein